MESFHSLIQELLILPWPKNTLYDFRFHICRDLFYGPRYGLSWCRFHGHLKRMCILLLGGVVYVDWILLVDGVKFYILADFLSSCSPIVKKEMLESPSIVWSCYSFHSTRTCIMFYSCYLVNPYLGLCLRGGLSLCPWSLSLLWSLTYLTLISATYFFINFSTLNGFLYFLFLCGDFEVCP